ncbi:MULTISPECIES: hypothetical protein [Tatumella]|uniref:Uncharacterized protein n=1 Tax=Tatumella punctata TaxID=399969 RepID=A0ABW1VSA3_9GAMM|nr:MULTISPECIES: hypothetical protein [unclassified Tatumella]MBS0855965.1 hypothetical protein [Tatumella sp. JGM16]MBS0878632.1 hypothetical protein [Tatumella sp. JGM82]MBS0892208.1 hypothetical protein [Tatumella sp. JGM94]MBS0895517.1 hypothetical protein [Tatumella sp. JGM130]MBS0903338.1 hypothetical protein [Tatumella sp. JGM100]
MQIFDTEHAIGFKIEQDGELIFLINKNGHIAMDKEQLLALLAMTRSWAEEGQPLRKI